VEKKKKKVCSPFIREEGESRNSISRKKGKGGRKTGPLPLSYSLRGGKGGRGEKGKGRKNFSVSSRGVRKKRGYGKKRGGKGGEGKERRLFPRAEEKKNSHT